MSMKTKLSCPFCGAKAEELVVLELEHGDGSAVVCNCCGAIGPRDYRPAEAVALWNGAALNALRMPAEVCHG